MVNLDRRTVFFGGLISAVNYFGLMPKVKADDLFRSELKFEGVSLEQENPWAAVTTIEYTQKLRAQLQKIIQIVKEDFQIEITFDTRKLKGLEETLNFKELQSIYAQIAGAQAAWEELHKYKTLKDDKGNFTYGNYFRKIRIVSDIQNTGDKRVVYASADPKNQILTVRVYPEQIKFAESHGKNKTLLIPTINFAKGKFDHEIGHLVLFDYFIDPKNVEDYMKEVYDKQGVTRPKYLGDEQAKVKADDSRLVFFARDYGLYNIQEDVATVVEALYTGDIDKNKPVLVAKANYIKKLYEERLGIKIDSQYWNIVTKFRSKG